MFGSASLAGLAGLGIHSLLSSVGEEVRRSQGFFIQLYCVVVMAVCFCGWLLSVQSKFYYFKVLFEFA